MVAGRRMTFLPPGILPYSLSFAIPISLSPQLWFFLFLIWFFSALIISFFFFSSELLRQFHPTMEHLIQYCPLLFPVDAKSCHPGCSVIILQGVAHLLHFSPWRVLRHSTEQRPQWLMLLTVRNSAGYFSLASSHFFFSIQPRFIWALAMC